MRFPHCVHAVSLPDIIEHPWDTSLSNPLPRVSFDLPVIGNFSTSASAAPVAPPPPPLVDTTIINPLPPPAPVITTRSGCSVRPPSRFDETSHSSIHAYSATFSHNFNTTSACILQPSQASYSEPHPMALMCEHVFAHITTDPDTMTLSEALRQPDRNKFLAAM